MNLIASSSTFSSIRRFDACVEAANPDDAHRRIGPSHNLASSLIHVEKRQIHNTNYTLRIDDEVYRIKRKGIDRKRIARGNGSSRETIGRHIGRALSRA